MSRTIEPNSGPLQPGVEARSLRRRLSPEVREAIAARYEAGESAKALSQEYGVSRDGVTSLLMSTGIAIRTRFVVTPEAAVRIVELNESGLTVRQVAAEVGCAYGTVRGVLHDNGGEVRVSPVGRRAKTDQ